MSGIYEGGDIYEGGGGGGGGAFDPEWTVISNDFTLNTSAFDFTRFFALYSEKLGLINLFINAKILTPIDPATAVNKKVLSLPSGLIFQSYVFTIGQPYDPASSINRGRLVIANLLDPIHYDVTRTPTQTDLYMGAFAWDNVGIRFFTAASMINVQKV